MKRAKIGTLDVHTHVIDRPSFMHVYQETCDVVFTPSQVKDLLQLFHTKNKTFLSGEGKLVLTVEGGWKGHLPK